MSGGGTEHLPQRQEQPVVPADPPVSGDANGRAALILPPDPEVEESEPNDRIQKANQIGFGQTVSGKLRNGEADWYVIPLPEDAPRDVELRVRHISGRYFSAHLFDSREVEQGWLQSDNGTHYARMDRKGHDRVYVRMTNDIGDGVSYEMSVLPGKEE
jgi:hypothetical protein